MPKVNKVVTWKFQELAMKKGGVPIDNNETVIVVFPVGELIIVNGKMTFNTKK